MRRKAFFVALVAVALTVAFASGTPQRAWEAARLVAVLGGATPQSAVVALQETAIWSEEGAARSGLLYRPANRRAEAALVLVPGADMAGQQHPLFIAFAETLASAGFLVLVPDIESLRQLRLSAADAKRIAGAVAHMAERPLGREGVVLAAISYAVGPAVLAALDPDVSDSVAAILGIGGYHDSRAAVTFLTTGSYRGPQGEWQATEAANHGRWVFLRANVGLLPSANDRALLLEMARVRRSDPNAPIYHLVELLGPEGEAVWAVLTNDSPDRVGPLIDALPPSIREELAALSLAERDLSRLQAELILVHGRDDPILPYTESQALAAAAPEARFYLLDSLAHVELDLSTVTDGWRLFSAAWTLLSVRDRLATGSRA
ncbi:alpha/beta hydrolase family protein [Algihabitans albus]|uniref:alpha/beta hydrolase family protein n=1 Tax=Algihabitans albus TaxID=2164067 RepID=UPI000E5CB704|nr:hypothetical protein [Algihabitans albus]